MTESTAKAAHNHYYMFQSKSSKTDGHIL